MDATTNADMSGKVLGKAGMASSEPLKYRLFEWLRENPNMRKRGYLKKAAAFLMVDYKAKKALLWRYASEYKTDIRSLPENGRGSNKRFCSRPDSQHACFAETWLADTSLDRLKFSDVTDVAIMAGWVLSKNKNKNLVWNKDRFTVGRIQWWLNGRVRVHIVDPHKYVEPMGRVKQLLYEAFISTGLIADLRISESFLRSVNWFSAHDVYDFDKPLQYKKITTYRELGVEEIVTGDLSHRKGLEVKTIKPDIVTKYEGLVSLLTKHLEAGKLEREVFGKVLEQNTQAIQGFNSYLAELSKPRQEPKKIDRLYE